MENTINVSVKPSETYAVKEKSILKNANEFKEKKTLAKNTKAITMIWGVLVILAAIGFSILLSNPKLSIALTIIISLLTIASFSGAFKLIVTIATSHTNQFINELYYAQKKFIESYGLRITDSEFFKLNFPDLYSKKRDVLYGTAEVVDESTGVVKKIMLRGVNNGQLVLLDENGKELNCVNNATQNDSPKNYVNSTEERNINFGIDVALAFLITSTAIMFVFTIIKIFSLA